MADVTLVLARLFRDGRHRPTPRRHGPQRHQTFPLHHGLEHRPRSTPQRPSRRVDPRRRLARAGHVSLCSASLSLARYAAGACVSPLSLNHAERLLIQPRIPDSRVVRILVIADPQIIDRNSYPGRGPLLSALSQFVVDLNLRKSWNFAFSHLRPHAVVVLGTLGYLSTHAVYRPVLQAI